MKKYIMLTSLIVANVSFGYKKEMDLKQQINKIKQDINKQERELKKITRKSQAKKTAAVQEIEESRISKVESKQAGIQERQQKIADLKEQLRQLEG